MTAPKRTLGFTPEGPTGRPNPRALNEIAPKPVVGSVRRGTVNEHIFTLDDSAWPIANARWSGAMTDDELALALRTIDGWLARQTRFGFLLDARGGRGLTSDQRRLVVAHMKSSGELSAKFLVQAIVHDNAIMRTLDNTIGWMLPRPFVSKTFADPEVALLWLNHELAAS